MKRKSRGFDVIKLYSLILAGVLLIGLAPVKGAFANENSWAAGKVETSAISETYGGMPDSGAASGSLPRQGMPDSGVVGGSLPWQGMPDSSGASGNLPGQDLQGQGAQYGEDMPGEGANGAVGVGSESNGAVVGGDWDWGSVVKGWIPLVVLAGAIFVTLKALAYANGTKMIRRRQSWLHGCNDSRAAQGIWSPGSNDETEIEGVRCH